MKMLTSPVTAVTSVTVRPPDPASPLNISLRRCVAHGVTHFSSKVPACRGVRECAGPHIWYAAAHVYETVAYVYVYETVAHVYETGTVAYAQETAPRV